MPRPAKVVLTADIGPLKEAVQRAKDILVSVGQVKIDPLFKKEITKNLVTEFDKSAKNVEGRIGKLRDAIGRLGKMGILDGEKIRDAVLKLGKLEDKLRDIKRAGEAVRVGNSKELGKIAAGAGAEGGAGGGAAMAGLMKGGAWIAGLLGVGYGAHQMYQTRMGIANERLRIRALTGGQTDDTMSGLGFTLGERRTRQVGIARALGRNINAQEMGGMVNEGERAERAYGVGGDEQAALMSAARRGGGGRENTKYFSQTIGSAVASGLEGSRISEFLQSMTSTLTDMSQGTVLDIDSIRGIAAAFTTLPIFKDDPARSFRTMQTVNQAFQHGDPFQSAMAYRTIMSANKVSDPATIELIRLFGVGAGGPQMKGLAGLMRNAGMKSLPGVLEGLDPKKTMRQWFKESKAGLGGMNEGGQLQQFLARSNMMSMPVEGATIFAKMKLAEKEGKDPTSFLSKEEIKKVQDANTDPTERLNQTFSGVDAKMKNLEADVNAINENVAKIAAFTVSSAVSDVAKSGGVSQWIMDKTHTRWMDTTDERNVGSWRKYVGLKEFTPEEKAARGDHQSRILQLIEKNTRPSANQRIPTGSTVLPDSSTQGKATQ